MSECVFDQNSFQEHHLNPAKAVRTAHVFIPEPPFPSLVVSLFHVHCNGAHAKSHAQILSTSLFSRSDSEHSVYIEKILHILQKSCTFANQFLPARTTFAIGMQAHPPSNLQLPSNRVHRNPAPNNRHRHSIWSSEPRHPYENRAVVSNETAARLSFL